MLAAMHPNDTDSNEFSSHQPDIAFDEESRPEPSVGFSFEDIQGWTEPEDDQEEFSAEDMERAFKVCERYMRWVWEGGGANRLSSTKDVRGLGLRGAILCWVFIKRLRRFSLTMMAEGLGEKKQSVGRWFTSFQEAFPEVKTPHMQNERPDNT
jgi:hypothetical protein